MTFYNKDWRKLTNKSLRDRSQMETEPPVGAPELIGPPLTATDPDLNPVPDEGLSLDEIAKEVNKLLIEAQKLIDQAQENLRFATGHYIEAGKLLLQARPRFAYGEWEPWVLGTFGKKSLSKVQRCMGMARRYPFLSPELQRAVLEVNVGLARDMIVKAYNAIAGNYKRLVKMQEADLETVLAEAQEHFDNLSSTMQVLRSRIGETRWQEWRDRMHEQCYRDVFEDMTLNSFSVPCAPYVPEVDEDNPASSGQRAAADLMDDGNEDDEDDEEPTQEMSLKDATALMKHGLADDKTIVIAGKKRSKKWAAESEAATRKAMHRLSAWGLSIKADHAKADRISNPENFPDLGTRKGTQQRVQSKRSH